MLHLVQALTQGAAKSARLWVATRGAQAVAGGPVAVAQSPIWGLSRTIALEHPELECVSVDLDPSEGTDGFAALADEIESRSREDRVAFRDRRRLVARLVRSAPPAVGGHRVPALDSEATYLITGGLGALGLIVARWMVERGARHLVLVGRSAPVLFGVTLYFSLVVMYDAAGLRRAAGRHAAVLNRLIDQQGAHPEQGYFE